MRFWRDSDRAWSGPTARPVPLIVLLVAGFVSAVAIAALRHGEVWTPPQRRHLVV